MTAPNSGDKQLLQLREIWSSILKEPDDARRVDALISHPQAAQLVAQVPAQDLYLLIRRHGLADSTELATLATPEQLRTFVDLDAWRRGTLDDAAAGAWLRALALGRDPALPAKVAGLDVELVALLLLRWTRVHAHDPEEPFPSEPRIVFITDDRCYYVELVSGEQEDVVRVLLGALRARHGALGLAVLLARLAGELPSPLEEQELHWRNSRLEDLGFLPYEESLRLYAPLPPGALRRRCGPVARAPETELPRWLARVEGGLLLNRALATCDEELRGRLEQDLVHLLNAAMIADGVEPDDDESVRRVLGRVRGYVEVALQMLVAGDAAGAATLLTAPGPRKLFRFTVTGLLGLMRRALLLRPRLAQRVGPGEQAWLDLLSRLPPRRADGSEFTSPEQVREAEAELLHLEAVADLLAAPDPWSGWPDDTPALAVFGTMLAQRALGQRPTPTALAPEDLQCFVALAFEDGRLRPTVRELATSLLADGLEDLARGARLAGRWCAALESELGGLDPRSVPDPRFVAGVLVGTSAAGGPDP